MLRLQANIYAIYFYGWKNYSYQLWVADWHYSMGAISYICAFKKKKNIYIYISKDFYFILKKAEMYDMTPTA